MVPAVPREDPVPNVPVVPIVPIVRDRGTVQYGKHSDNLLESVPGMCFARLGVVDLASRSILTQSAVL